MVHIHVLLYMYMYIVVGVTGVACREKTILLIMATQIISACFVFLIVHYIWLVLNGLLEVCLLLCVSPCEKHEEHVYTY